MDFNYAHDDMEDNEDYDEFLFESIHRYNTLQMFNLENIPCRLFQIDNTSLCIVSKSNKGNKSELLKLKLPDKLTLPESEESRCKGNDFKVLSGIYSESIVSEVCKLTNDEKIITSEKDVIGLKIYELQYNSWGKKMEEQRINVVPWSAPEFVVNFKTNSVICSKCNHEPLIEIDVMVNKKIKEIEHPFYTLNISPNKWQKIDDPCNMNSIKCQVLGRELISVLNILRGEVVLHDLRTNNCFVSLPRIKEKCSKEIWTISGCDSWPSSLPYFGILSNRKSFCAYDIRNNSILFQNVGTGDPIENYNNMRLKFNTKGDKFSISGMNSLVDVYNINEGDFSCVFTHNGHNPSNSSLNFVTDHVWFDTGNKELVFSICDNRTLNCWDYNVKC